MGEKLSAFTPAIPGILDYFAGCSPTSPDLKYQLSTFVSGVQANGNQTFTVDPSGSDSNPGTVGAPFATYQHAVNVGASFNYQGVYTLTINGNAGTFINSTQVNLPQLVNYPANLFGNILGAGPASVTVKSTSGIGWFAAGSGSTWLIDGITTDTFIYGMFAASGAYIFNKNAGQIAFIDSTHGSSLRCYNSADNALIQSLASVDISGLTNMYAFGYIGGTVFSAFEYNIGTVTLPSSNFGSQWWFSNFNFEGLFTWSPGSVVNSSKWQGAQVFATTGTIVATLDGTLSSIPGTATGNVFDSTVRIQSLNTSLAATTWQEKSGLPTTTDLPNPKSWGVFKDNSGKGDYLVENDGGKIVYLGSASATALYQHAAFGGV